MELICYTHDGWVPRLRAASSRRSWMDDTPERYAYRCLPLAIANAHGWELLSPCGFEARWDGGAGANAVRITPDAGSPPHQLPVSLFGHGTLTFHVEGIFRTPAGWSLWIGGAPNDAKDGIAPLGGVIETDWSPYTFTMNWRFTRPNHAIRFEENEPFCFLFPIERAPLAQFVPQIRPIDEAPDLKANFREWSNSRDAFQQWVRDTHPTAPADKWQKLYYRGVDPKGRAGAADHLTKIRLLPFRDAAGNAAVIPEPRACPVARPEPAKPAAFSLTAKATGAGARMGGLIADDVLGLALSRIAFDRADPVRRLAPASTERKVVSATPPVAAARPIDPALALRRRDWLLDVQERQRGVSSRGGIDRVRDLTADRFRDEYYAASRPVVIQGVLDDWPALARWTPAYLKNVVGDAAVTYQGGRQAQGDYELFKDRHKQVMPFDRFIDLIEAPGAANDAYVTAYNNADNRTAFAPLDRDLRYIDTVLTRAHGMLWIGPGGTFTPLHFDLTNNLLAQFRGTKQVILVPPSETRHLHHHRHVFSDVHDITDDGWLSRYPSATRARRFHVDLAAGDLLYIPVGWWHQVRARDFSVTATYTNFLWPNDAYEGFPPD